MGKLRQRAVRQVAQASVSWSVAEVGLSVAVEFPSQVLPTRLFCFPNIKAGNYRARIISSASTPSVTGRTDHGSRQAECSRD